MSRGVGYRELTSPFLLSLADRESGAACKQEGAQGGRHQKGKEAGKARAAVTEGVQAKEGC